MKRLTEMSHEQVIAYNLRDGGTAVTFFAEAQTYRVQKARWFIQAVLNAYSTRAVIWEPGCSSGDISGHFANHHDVHGIDVVPAAVEATKRRWPGMHVYQGQAEQFEPVACDILVLCEFLEHITEPVEFVQRWLPLAKNVVIGHPLNDPGNMEPGHVWCYDYADYLHWYELGGHRMVETHLFSGPFPEMVMGLGVRA